MTADIIAAFNALPSNVTTAGEHSMLRVIATFPTEVKLSRAVIRASRGSPVATLNAKLFKKTTASLPAEGLFSQIVSSVTGARKRREESVVIEESLPSRKRGRESEDHASTSPSRSY